MKIKNLLMTLTFMLFAMAVNTLNAQTESDQIEQDFETDMNDWTYVCDDNDDYEYGTISDQANHTLNGLQSFHFEGAPYSYGYLISPKLSYSGGVDLSFFYTNYYEGGASFRVGYCTDEIDFESFDPDLFEWGSVIVANQGNKPDGSVEGWLKYANDFPEGVKYIAIAFADNELNLFVDDFVINETSCSKPIVSEIVSEKTSLKLSWEDSNDSYVVRYKGGFPTSFEYGFEGWTTINDDEDVYNWDLAHEEGEGHNESDYFVYSESYHAVGTNVEELWPDNYLVSPLVPLGGSITFWAKGLDEMDYMEHFGVAISTDGNQDPDDFETVIEWTAMGDWMKYSVDLSQYSDMGYVAIRHFRCDECDAQSALCVDDITIFTTPDWTEMAPTEETSVMINDLMYETNYVIQLRGICNENDTSSWTNELFVMTEDVDCRFVKAGDWNVSTNWRNNAIPGANSDVVIAAAVTIPEDCVAQSNNISLSMGSITIQDGGQLKHNNAGVVVTMEKNIKAYTEGEKDHYYLIATPIDGLDPVDVGMITDNYGSNATPETSTYDFYWFDQSDEAEWRNYRQTVSTSLVRGLGYLYANREDVTLTFSGELNTFGDVSLVYDGEAGFRGWNLVGNPFMCDAYIGRPFYRLTPESDELEPVENGAIAPLEGVFVKAEDENDDEISFSREETSKGSVLNVNVIREEADIDVARVRFGEGHNLEKFQLNPNHTKVYFPQNGRNYAVVNAGSIDELPFNFESENDGTFTLSFTQEQVDFSYLHLIDNITGADVDLLQEPEYTFESTVSDYPSRFRLVFVAKDTEGNVENSESFAFNSNGNFIIVNEGLATLQVIDVQGRMISSETIDGCVSKNLQAAPGVYVLRLINGENVMTQKIVVR